MQPPPGGVQIPQLLLQHSSPGAHVFGPHVRQASWVHATPGLVQTPQLSLQQTKPASQVTEPHWLPAGRQSSVVQGSPGLVQYPQLSLQHSKPAAQTFGPHFPPAGRQSSVVHGSPGFVQYPQLSLQHTKPAEQTVFPQASPPIGTHCGFKSIILQVEFEAQRTPSQVIAITWHTGLAMVQSANDMSTKAERGLRDVMLFDDIDK